MSHKLPGFKRFMDDQVGHQWIEKSLHQFDKQELFQGWYSQSGESGEIYPSQGLLTTEYDYLNYLGKTLLSDEELADVIATRYYFLQLFNHPQRIKHLEKIDASPFKPLPKIESPLMDYALDCGLSLSIGDLGARVVGTEKKRVARRKLLQSGPFIKLGKYARIPFSAGAMPDVFGAPAAIATMAMSHAIAGLPRNGVFTNPQRQADLALATLEWIKSEPIFLQREDRKTLLRMWQRNIMGVVEPELDLGLKRVEVLYKAGVKSFRVYSPEPGKDAITMVKTLRKKYGDELEIFAGQAASVEQAQQFESAGADGIYIGIGGGGRCITAVRSGSVVDWPQLLWRLRGNISIPVIVEGGASDSEGVTLLLGASGIGVSRAAAGGTIESPGGLLYLVGKDGIWFKPYGGEASARTKYLDGKMLPFGIPAFVEGETTKAIKSYVPYIQPTVAANMYFLLEDVILSLVFRGCSSIEQLQSLSPSPLRRLSANGEKQQDTH